MSQAKYHQFKKKCFTCMCIVLKAVHANYSGRCDLSAKVIILLFAHATKKTEILKRALWRTDYHYFKSCSLVFLMKLFWSFKALSAHSHDPGQGFMKC